MYKYFKKYKYQEEKCAKSFIPPTILMQNLFLRGYAGLQAGGAAPLHLQEGQGRVGQPATKEESLYDSRHNW